MLAWLGLISYGIYLWHVTIIQRLARTSLGTLPMFIRVVVIALIGAGITIGCAAVSYYVLERPLLRHKYSRPRLSRGRTQTLAASTSDAAEGG